jgi:hypothetical protein
MDQHAARPIARRQVVQGDTDIVGRINKVYFGWSTRSVFKSVGHFAASNRCQQPLPELAFASMHNANTPDGVDLEPGL